MAPKKMIVKGDAVKGTDTHEVSGTSTPPGGTPTPGTWKGTYSYEGSMTEALSDFVKIGSDSVATVDSRSSQSSAHIADSGTPFTPAAPVPDPQLSFTKAHGKGAPSTGAGSSFVKIGNSAVLLHEDKIDTCGDERGTGNSTVESSKQSFVTVTE